MSRSDNSFSQDRYKDAGVDIAAGNALVKAIGPAAKSTARPGVMGALGGFGGLFDLKACGFKDPLLVSGADGVGTKLLMAQQSGLYHDLGQDLVAMCVNDVVVLGAEPLFFLDYMATGALDVEQMAAIVDSIARACSASGCALIGGETAEMPGLYAPGHYDLAGFVVAGVERDQVLTGKDIMAGDIILGLPSSGPHSNGFSLIRKIMGDCGIDLNSAVENGSQSWAEALMAPTALYVQPCLALNQARLAKGFAHITGGGWLENIPRILPNGMMAELTASQTGLPPIFAALADYGTLSPRDLLRTFNCGIGMVVIVDPDQESAVRDALATFDISPVVIGQVAPCNSGLSCHITDAENRWSLGHGWTVTLDAETAA